MSVCARGQSEARCDGGVPHGGDNSGAQAAIRRTPAFEDAVGGGSSRRSSVAAPRWHPETRRACPDGSAGIARGGLAPQIDHICALGGHAGRRCGDRDAVGPGCANSAFPAHETPGGCRWVQPRSDVERGGSRSMAQCGRCGSLAWTARAGVVRPRRPRGARAANGRRPSAASMEKSLRKKVQVQKLKPLTSTEPPLIAPKSICTFLKSHVGLRRSRRAFGNC